MRPVLGVFCYAIAVAWVLPLVLVRLSEKGVSPRLGLAAWLAAMFSVVASATVALALLTRMVVAGWPAFARTVCESVTADACPPALYRNAAYELGLAVAAFLGGTLLIFLGWRYGRSLRRASVRTRAHAEAARITGRRVGGTKPAFVLDAAQPAVYCVPGRPPTIVLTTGALAVLEPEQLTAVLAHERAHLAGRHHLLLAMTRSLAAAVPAVPLFARGTGAVARLAEMRADDIAARPSHRRTLMAALLAMSGGDLASGGAAGGGGAVAQAPPAAWLAATGGIVDVRVRRLADPPLRGQRFRYGLALAALILAITAASVLVSAIAIAGL
jgi:Zn-dependent protease with chaperone function